MEVTMSRDVLQSFGKGQGEFSGGIVLAKQDISDGIPRRVTKIPGVDKTSNRIHPWQSD